MDRGGERQDECGEFADAPRDSAAQLLVVKGADPRLAHVAVPLGFNEHFCGHDRNAEEGVEGHGHKEHHEPHRVGEALHAGVHADHGLREHVARRQEVDDHKFMAQVELQRVPHDAAVVEDDERTGEVDRRDNRVSPEAHVLGVHQDEDPFAHTARTVLAGVDGTHEQRNGSAHNHGDRHEHDNQHVLDHVAGEQHAAVHHGTAARDVDEHGHAAHPRNGAPQRPLSAALLQFAVAHDVQD